MTTDFSFALSVSKSRVVAKPAGVSTYSSWDYEALFRTAAVLAFAGLLVYACHEM